MGRSQRSSAGAIGEPGACSGLAEQDHGAIATDVPWQCFSRCPTVRGRKRNNPATVVAPPYYARTNDTNRGIGTKPPARVTWPREGDASGGNDQRAAAAGPNQWVILSTYKLVTGRKLSGSRRWDCSTTNASKHWTSEVESYCLSDFLSVLNAIPKARESWTRPPSPKPGTCASPVNWPRFLPSLTPMARRLRSSASTGGR